MPRLGPYSSNDTLSKSDGRTREARLVKSLRNELIAHCGGQPSVIQQMLIAQCCSLRLRIALMERDGLGYDVTDQRQVQYLAWVNSLGRLLDKLGVEPPPAASTKPTSTLADYIAAKGVAA